MIYTDHSRIATHEHCPRERYWLYEHEGRGLERVALNIDAEVGSTVHRVLQDVLNATQAGRFGSEVLERSLATHVAAFDAEVRERGLALELASGYEADEDGNVQTQEGQLGMIVDVYSSWIRQIARAWCVVRLPRLVLEYEIVSTEQEEELLLAEGAVTFMARTDALLRRRCDGELFILNYKTVGEANQWWQEQWPLDMQTLSEVLPVEARLGQRVAGVLIEGLVKGGKRLQYPPGSGMWWINSPLVWSWRQDAVPPFAPSYAAKYEWVGEDGKSHRLGKGWHKQPMWEDEMGLAGWMEWLLENERELVEQQFVSLPPILRSELACVRWQQGVEFNEQVISTKAGHMLGRDDFEWVNAAFPMHTSSGNCIKYRGGDVSTGANNGKCSCYELCHGIAASSPLDSGYRWRTPNHPKEEERWQSSESAVQSPSTSL